MVCFWDEVLDAKLLDGDGCKDMVSMLDMLSVWAPLAKAVESWDALGNDEAERVDKDRNKEAIKLLLGAAAAAAQFGTKTFGGIVRLATYAGEVDEKVARIRETMLPKYMASLNAEHDKLLDIAGGGAGGISWTIAIPEAKKDDEDAVVKVAKKALLSMKGEEFDKLLGLVSDKYESTKEVYELFGQSLESEKASIIEATITTAKATKYTALMLAKFEELQQNLPKLARVLKKFRTTVMSDTKLKDQMHPLIMKWSEKFVSIGGIKK